MSETVQLVARAIENVGTCRECGVICPDGHTPLDCEGRRCSFGGPTPDHKAKAAIQAMRFADMSKIYQRVIEQHRVMRGGEAIMGEIWNAMIDAALVEPIDTKTALENGDSK